MGSSADKLLSFVNAYIEFVAGEQPTADKFNALVAQTKYGFNGLERAVGDIWTTTYAFGEDNAHLSTQWGPNYTTGGYVSGSDDVGRALDIVNIGRAIGPMSNLNPLILSPEGGMGIEGENVPNGVHEFTLRYIPLPDPSGSGTLAYSDFSFLAADGSSLSEFDTWATTPEDVSTAGTFHVTAYGCVYTYDATPTNAVVSYSTDPNYWAGGPNPPNARFNVIPDPNQFGNASEYLRITFEDTTGNYYVTLPTVREQQNNHTNDTASLSGIDANFNLPILLPEVITENFEPGQAIPEGFIYIRNVTRGETFIDATYSYNDENTLVISDVDLHGDDSSILDDEQWVLFTVGTDITSNLNDVQQKVYKHSHSRAFGEPQVHVSDLAGIYEAQKDSTSYYGPSDMEGNWFSQYLHRDGYQTDGNHSNNNNAMRGDLVLGITQDAGGTSDSSGGRNYLSSEGESYVISFGNSKADDGLQSPMIWRNENETLKVRGQEQNTRAEDGGGSGYIPSKEAHWSENDQSITLDSRGDLVLTTEYSDTGGATGIFSGAIRMMADAEKAPDFLNDELTSLSKGGIRIQATNNIFLQSDERDVGCLAARNVSLKADKNVFIKSQDYDPSTTSSESYTTLASAGWVRIETDPTGYSGSDWAYPDPEKIKIQTISTAQGADGGSIKLITGHEESGDPHGTGRISLITAWNAVPAGKMTRYSGVQIFGSNDSEQMDYSNSLLKVHARSTSSEEDGETQGSLAHFKITQTNEYNTADVLILDVGWSGGEAFDGRGRNTQWLQFRYDSSDNDVQGGVRMNSSYEEEPHDRAFILIDNEDGSGDVAKSGSGNETLNGSAQFYSLGGDYAEWILCGDSEEWREPFEEAYKDIEDFNYDQYIKDRMDIDRTKGARSLGLPEGMLVWVRDGENSNPNIAEFYKDGPGVPMVITRRACVVGNSNLKNKESIGELLCFIGQLPVRVAGPSKPKDYIVPHKEYNGVCMAVDRNEISFEDYKDAIGTVVGVPQSADKDKYVKVLCLIGIK